MASPLAGAAKIPRRPERTAAQDAALTLAWLGLRPSATEPVAPVAGIAQTEFVEAGKANASTMVYVDKESGWLGVWALDSDANSKG